MAKKKVRRSKKIVLKPRPEIGKFYHFWDDGKTSASRHYICKCEDIITPVEAQGILIQERYGDPQETDTLYNIWKDEVNRHRNSEGFTVIGVGIDPKPGAPWLYAEETDCFIKLSCPKYDDYDLWAVRTVDGGWFTMDVQSGWQGGRLDVTGEIYSRILEEYTDEGWNTLDYTEQTY